MEIGKLKVAMQGKSKQRMFRQIDSASALKYESKSSICLGQAKLIISFPSE